MTVISLKDYAKQKNISYEAVRKQVNRYKDELEGHLIKDGRQQFLDEEAVAFLDGKRQKNPITLVQDRKNEVIEDLQQENKNLLIKIAAQADQIAELERWKADFALKSAKIELLEEVTEQDKQRIDELQSRSEALEEQNKELTLENEKMRSASFWKRLRGFKKETEEE